MQAFAIDHIIHDATPMQSARTIQFYVQNIELFFLFSHPFSGAVHSFQRLSYISVAASKTQHNTFLFALYFYIKLLIH